MRVESEMLTVDRLVAIVRGFEEANDMTSGHFYKRYVDGEYDGYSNAIRWATYYELLLERAPDLRDDEIDSKGLRLVSA